MRHCFPIALLIKNILLADGSCKVYGFGVCSHRGTAKQFKSALCVKTKRGSETNEEWKTSSYWTNRRLSKPFHLITINFTMKVKFRYFLLSHNLVPTRSSLTNSSFVMKLKFDLSKHLSEKSRKSNTWKFRLPL